MISKFTLVLSVSPHETDQEPVALLDHGLMLLGHGVLVLSAILDKVEGEFVHPEIHHQTLVLFIFKPILIQEHNVLLVFQGLAVFLGSQVLSNVFFILELAD